LWAVLVSEEFFICFDLKVSGFTLKSSIYFEFIFVQGEYNIPHLERQTSHISVQMQNLDLLLTHESRKGNTLEEEWGQQEEYTREGTGV
jgi:hypothetical protein